MGGHSHNIIISTTYNISVCDLSGNVESLAAQSRSIPTLVSEGLAIAYFVYAQCLYLGQGIIRDVQKANTCFTKVHL